MAWARILAKNLAAVCWAGVLPAISPGPLPAQDIWTEARHKMVRDEIEAAGVKSPSVLDAMRHTPRHEFVDLYQRKRAYLDMALPIGERQTISPPFVVAYMTEQLDPQPSDRVLEIGTGSGYQAAVLSPLCEEIYTIEIVESLGKKAAKTLERLKYENVHVRVGDGYLGWPEEAPFDKIIVTCSPESVPQPLVEQLREGGRMVVPVGERYSQNLYLFTKKGGKLVSEALRATLFVPMTGEAEESRQVLPDPLRPQILNGSFEDLVGEEKKPANWHYLRQMSVVTDDPLAPDGKNYVEFSNKEPGRGCRALQGFAVDGRKVARLAVSYRVRGKNIRFGQDQNQWPFFVITFYDERRSTLRRPVALGPYRGSFPWRREQFVIDVPIRAREAIMRIGLLGAVGAIAYDDLELRAVEP